MHWIFASNALFGPLIESQTEPAVKPVGCFYGGATGKMTNDVSVCNEDPADRIEKLLAAHRKYSSPSDGDPYDEVLLEIQASVQRSGSLGKADIGALMLWKRLNLSTRWTRALNTMADREVRMITGMAIEQARDAGVDIPTAAREARRILKDLPGCKSGHAVASTILTAGAPIRMAVYDVRALTALQDLKCPSPEGSYGNYMEIVVDLTEEINRDGLSWCPRDVDKALYMLGGA